MNEKIVCWIGDAPNHKALVAKISARFNVAGVVIDRKKTVNAKKAPFIKRVIDKFKYGKIDNAWAFIQQYYKRQFPFQASLKTITVDSINSDEALRFTNELRPDLIIVSGTSLVKEPLLSVPVKKGIMNLHTGLSPYVKGGPNCTNWCIANNEWQLVGNTIMWLSAGIDSGNIITSETIDVRNEKNLPDIHLKVMEHAHDLYLRAIDHVLKMERPQSVPQNEIAKGTLYLTKMWDASRKRSLLDNLKGEKLNGKHADVRTVPLPQ